MVNHFATLVFAAIVFATLVVWDHAVPPIRSHRAATVSVFVGDDAISARIPKDVATDPANGLGAGDQSY